jgi:hypothetical protein
LVGVVFYEVINCWTGSFTVDSTRADNGFKDYQALLTPRESQCDPNDHDPKVDSDKLRHAGSHCFVRAPLGVVSLTLLASVKQSARLSAAERRVSHLAQVVGSRLSVKPRDSHEYLYCAPVFSGVNRLNNMLVKLSEIC